MGGRVWQIPFGVLHGSPRWCGVGYSEHLHLGMASVLNDCNLQTRLLYCKCAAAPQRVFPKVGNVLEVAFNMTLKEAQ